MAVPVVTVGADAAVAEVWRLMQSAHLGHVAVVDDANQCLGILDVHDLWVSWAFDLEAGHPRTVLHLVTATPAVTPDTPLSQLCVALLGSRCGAVVVLNDKGALRGVVTATDVLRAVAEHEEDRPC
jgi:CBS domain-containing protein